MAILRVTRSNQPSVGKGIVGEGLCPAHTPPFRKQDATVQPNLWEGCILNSFLKGKSCEEGGGWVWRALHIPPAPPESLKSRYPSRLEGLVWIRLGFSSDFPQELGLYA